MAYRFDPEDRSLEAGLRRIALAELSAALQRMEGQPTPTGIHEVRKHIKKLRGLLRLLKPGFRQAAAENAILRDAAKTLSPLRDSEVRLATFDRLVAKDRPASLAPLRGRLANERDAVASIPGHLDEAAAALAALRDRTGQWRLKGDDRAILIAGLADTRRRARITMAAAATHDLHLMHEWRKRVKDTWYQARLLAPVWPGVMNQIADAAGVLGEDLGDHHDYGMLAEHIAAIPPDDLDPAVCAEALALTRAAQITLEQTAFPAGALLFAGKPKAVARLWADWWGVSRG